MARLPLSLPTLQSDVLRRGLLASSRAIVAGGIALNSMSLAGCRHELPQPTEIAAADKADLADTDLMLRAGSICDAHARAIVRPALDFVRRRVPHPMLKHAILGIQTAIDLYCATKEKDQAAAMDQLLRTLEDVQKSNMAIAERVAALEEALKAKERADEARFRDLVRIIREESERIVREIEARRARHRTCGENRYRNEYGVCVDARNKT